MRYGKILPGLIVLLMILSFFSVYASGGAFKITTNPKSTEVNNGKINLAKAYLTDLPGNKRLVEDKYPTFSSEYLQVPEYWAKTFGGTSNEIAFPARSGKLIRIPNGDSVIVTTTESFGTGRWDIWVLYMDPLGNIKWQKAYGTPRDEGYYLDAVLTPENNLLIVTNVDSSDILIFEIDLRGNLMWSKRYTIGNTLPKSLTLTKTGDILIIADTLTPNIAKGITLMRLDRNGNLKWAKVYERVKPTRVGIDDSGNVIVTGNIGDDIWIAKLDENGSVLWQNSYGTDDSIERSYGLAISPQGEIIVVGYCGVVLNGEGTIVRNADGLLMKIDKNGNIIWQKSFGTLHTWEDFADVAIDNSGDIFVVGSRYYEDNRWDVWTVKTDKDGNVIWQKRYGGKDIDLGVFIGIYNTKSLIVGGNTKSWGAGGKDLWLLKVPTSNGFLKDVSLDTYSQTVNPNLTVQATAVTSQSIQVTDKSTSLQAVETSAVVKTQSMTTLRLKTRNPAFFISSYHNFEFNNVRDIKVDSSDHIIVIGSVMSKYNDTDIWVSRLGSDGRVIWTKIIKSWGTDEYPSAVDVDWEGNIIVAGTRHYRYSNNEDMLIIKLSPEGTVLWERGYWWTGDLNESAHDVVVDPTGNIIVVGKLSSASTSSKALILKVTPNGWEDFMFTYWFDDSEPTSADAVAMVGDNGDFVVAGYTHINKPWPLADQNAVWAMRFDSEGNKKWNSDYTTGIADDYGIGVSKIIADSPNIYLIGWRSKLGECNNGLIIDVSEYDGREIWKSDYDFNSCEGFSDAVISGEALIATGWKNSMGLLVKVDKYSGTLKYEQEYTDAKPRIKIEINSLNTLIIGGELSDSKSLFVEWGSDLGDSLQILRTSGYSPETSRVSANDAVLLNQSLIIGGSGTTPGYSDLDIYIMSANRNTGTPVWSKFYGTTAFNEELKALTVDSAGNIIAVGTLTSYTLSKCDSFVLKLNPKGEIIWAKEIGNQTLSTTYRYCLQDVAVDSEDNIIAVGTVSGGGSGLYDIWVVKFDHNGHILWQKSFGGSFNDQAQAVAVASDGKIIVAGTTQSFDINRIEIIILSLDKNGKLEWQKLYQAGNYTIPYTVSITPNGDIIVGGSVLYLESSSGYEAFLMRLDNEGNIKWVISDGGKYRDGITSSAVDTNGDIIAAGYTGSFGSKYLDAWILRLNRNGQITWQKRYGGNDTDYISGIVIAPNGDIIATGETRSWVRGYKNVWLLQLPYNGNTLGCKICMDIVSAPHRLRVETYYVSISQSNEHAEEWSYLLRESKPIQEPLVQYFQKRVWADVDINWMVNSIDALLYLRFAVDLDILPYHVDPVADDMTGDSKITATDALKVLRIAVGLD